MTNVTRNPNIPDATDTLPTDAGLYLEEMQPPKKVDVKLAVIVGSEQDEKYFKMGIPNFNKEETVKIGDHESKFNITVGPLAAAPESEQFVLEVDYEDSLDAHTRSLRANSFGAMLYHDYAFAANNIAIALCKEKGWNIDQHLCSYPIFRAVISKSPESLRENTGDRVRKIFN